MDAGRLDAATSAPFIARQLATPSDPGDLAWGSQNLSASARVQATATRGLQPAEKALAHNLARNAPDAL